LNHWGQGKFRAFSAGSFPKGQVHPMAVELLKRMNLPAEGFRSKSWDEFAAPGGPPIDFILYRVRQRRRRGLSRLAGKADDARTGGIADPRGRLKALVLTKAFAFRKALKELDTRIKTLYEFADRLARRYDAAK